MAPRPLKPGVILPIQYLRGIAAMMVVLHHSIEQVPGVIEIYPWKFGTSGVDLFFVISGFIMVVTTAGPDVDPWQFLKRRFIRVVPLYWLLTLTMVAIALIVPSLFRSLKVTPGALAQSLLFIPHFSTSFPDKAWPLLVPGWTLNYEMFFYLVFGLSLALPRAARLAAVTTVFVALITLGLLFGPFESPAAQVYTSPLLIEFAAGSVIGRAWLNGRIRLPMAVSVSLLLIGAAMLVFRDRAPLGEWMQIIGAALMVVGALNKSFATWKSPKLQAVGDSSYSLYLTHLFTLGALRVVWIHFTSNTQTPITATAYLLIAMLSCVAVGWMAWRWIEVPSHRFLGGRQATPKPSPITSRA